MINDELLEGSGGSSERAGLNPVKPGTRAGTRGFAASRQILSFLVFFTSGVLGLIACLCPGPGVALQRTGQPCEMWAGERKSPDCAIVLGCPDDLS